jgi:hypothetical protein
MNYQAKYEKVIEDIKKLRDDVSLGMLAYDMVDPSNPNWVDGHNNVIVRTSAALTTILLDSIVYEPE